MGRVLPEPLVAVASALLFKAGREGSQRQLRAAALAQPG
jgi:hypothetical protein